MSDKEFKIKNLKRRQLMDLELKIMFTKQRVEEFYNKMKGKVYVSFSGGKDSTVLLHLVREMYPEVKAVFVDTGLEYPEIREFVKKIDNVVWLKPKIPFNKVIEKYGYPAPSKRVAMLIDRCRRTKSERVKSLRLTGKYKDENTTFVIPKKFKRLYESDILFSEKCCDVMKKRPAKKFQKESGFSPFIGTMAEESKFRKDMYIKNGCNSFEKGKEKSLPISFWLEKDIWEYIKKYNLKYSKIYDMGETRTGCMFCTFGVCNEKGSNRFQRMAVTHPKQYDYCINKLRLNKVLDLMEIDYKPIKKKEQLTLTSNGLEWQDITFENNL